MTNPVHRLKKFVKYAGNEKPSSSYVTEAVGWLGSGVKDENDREIFEGDIVKYVGDDFFGVALKGSTATVIFDHGGFWVFTLSLVNFNDGGLEVVGHIAEDES